MCRLNITSRAVVGAMAINPILVKQFNCDDQADDPLVPADLGMVKNYE